MYKTNYLILDRLLLLGLFGTVWTLGMSILGETGPILVGPLLPQIF